MSAADDRQSALETIREDGQPVTLTQVVTGAYDPDTGTSSTTETNHNGFGVALYYSQNMIDNSNILMSDQRVYINPQLGATPKPGDKLTFGGVSYTVITSKPLAPAGIVLLHEVQVRL